MKRFHLRSLLAVVLALAVGAPSLALAKTVAKAGPPPLPLPTPKKKKKKATPTVTPTVVAAPAGPTDCTVTVGKRQDGDDTPEIGEGDRDEKGGKTSNSAGLSAIREAEGTSDTVAKRKRYIEAVGLLLDGLEADPYNPNLNYNIAAAYSRLGKKACMLKFVKRVVALTRRKSTKEAAVARFTHMTKGYPKEKRPPDPDFDDYRDDPDFQAVIAGDFE